MRWFKIKNETAWSTNDLRVILMSACNAAGMTGTPAVVIGNTGRRMHKFFSVGDAPSPETVLRNRIRGWAFVQSPSNPGRIRMLLPRPDQVPEELRDLFKAHVAQVAHHEALHAVGGTHKDMTDEQRWCRQDVPWAAFLRLRTKAEVSPPVPREERQAADQIERLEHVRSMHKKALTRLKRATTFEKKWRARLKRLERKST